MVTTFRIRLKKARKPIQLRLGFNLVLRNPDKANTFQATIGGKLAHLGLKDDDMDTDTTSFIFNIPVT